MSKGGFFRIAAIVAAATIGDGVFALPYVFYHSGWFLGLFYLVILAALVIAAHVVYLQTLEKVGEKERLLGLTKMYLGNGGFWLGFVAIVLGLLLTLVAYLILGAQFIHLAFPGLLPAWLPFLVFWLFAAATVLLRDTRVVELELSGIFFTSIIIILIFLTALPNVGWSGAPAMDFQNLFLPFGAIFFSLAGWTGIEPAYESRKRSGRFTGVSRALASGTIFASILYLLFVTGVLGTSSSITPDTISGLGGWPAWKRNVIAILGLLAVWTVSMPISREIKNSLENDLHWDKFYSRALILVLPIILVFLGLNNFLTVIGLVGGIFLSLQYLLIVSVGRRALALSSGKKFLLDVVALVFILAAVYSLYAFVVH